QLDFVLRHGRKFRGHRANHYFFGRKESLKTTNVDPRWLERLEGVTVVVSLDGSRVLTVYRNRNAPKNLKKKAA
ncbi:MAG: hypothetical protein EA415_00195, partial [Sphaerobacteraceae bacterium]